MPLRRLLVCLFVLVCAAAPQASAASKRPPAPTTAPSGYDVSYPQCGSTLPSAPLFGVVGIDGGVVRKANPCLSTEAAWARGATSDPQPGYYVNTANPGPRVSTHWPTSTDGPRACAASYPANDSTACAYDYGWANASDSWSRATSAGLVDLSAAAWWLDVETGNSWESLQYGGTSSYFANDLASLQGQLDFLVGHGVVSVGVYSTAYQWSQVVGGAKLATAPVWYAGVGTLTNAQAHCSNAVADAFTGGRVTMAQYARNGYDADLRC
jgi:hypothetical protein